MKPLSCYRDKSFPVVKQELAWWMTKVGISVCVIRKTKIRFGYGKHVPVVVVVWDMVLANRTPATIYDISLELISFRFLNRK